jgi:hypothetical protein
MRWYEHILRMNNERILKKEEDHGKKLRSSSGSSCRRQI